MTFAQGRNRLTTHFCCPHVFDACAGAILIHFDFTASLRSVALHSSLPSNYATLRISIYRYHCSLYYRKQNYLVEYIFRFITQDK